MGDSLGSEAQSLFEKAISICRPTKTAAVLVLSKRQRELKEQLHDTELCRVLDEHPVTLRTIRKTLEEIWSKAL